MALGISIGEVMPTKVAECAMPVPSVHLGCVYDGAAQS